VFCSQNAAQLKCTKWRRYEHMANDDNKQYVGNFSFMLCIRPITLPSYAYHQRLQASYSITLVELHCATLHSDHLTR